MTGALLDIRDLGIATDARRGGARVDILKGINLTLDRGQVLGLIGESGAGKSTLGLAAMGYAKRGLRKISGQVILDGQELHPDDKDQLRRLMGRKVSYVAQSAAAAFNPAHKLLAQVLEVVQIHGHMDPKQAVTEALDLFARMGLPAPDRFGDRYPHEVSGGQLQRAMTAMALVGRPDLVVFDEPTTALDVTTQIDVLAIIKDVIRELGTAALYVSHDIAVVSQISDRIKVLRHGEEIEEQETQSLLSNPIESYTRDLLGARDTASQRPVKNDDDAILSIRNVSASYGKVQVLRDVSLTLRQGSNLAIVGESGSGKSTLARVVTGLLAPTNGAVSFRGARLPPTLTGRTKAQRRTIQLIYQLPDVAMNPRQTVADIVGRPAQLFGGRSKSGARERAVELLQMVELDPSLAGRYPGQLSGGQKQRVCIARALAAEPDLILCDEVTSALDPLVAGGILRLLLRLQAELGISYIFITHDIGMVRAIADDVVVMRNGQVVEQGTKADIFSPPFADYTHLLISSTPMTRVGWLEQAINDRRTSAAGH